MQPLNTTGARQGNMRQQLCDKTASPRGHPCAVLQRVRRPVRVHGSNLLLSYEALIRYTSRLIP
jgi:hypothetical protein